MMKSYPILVHGLEWFNKLKVYVFGEAVLILKVHVKYIWDPDWAITVPANIAAHNDARPSVGKVHGIRTFNYGT